MGNASSCSCYCSFSCYCYCHYHYGRYSYCFILLLYDYCYSYRCSYNNIITDSFHPSVFRAPIPLADPPPPPALGQSGGAEHAAGVAPRGISPGPAAPGEDGSPSPVQKSFHIFTT
ncbi:unnamed protein product, partial [Laminaria digitata]